MCKNQISYSTGPERSEHFVEYLENRKMAGYIMYGKVVEEHKYYLMEIPNIGEKEGFLHILAKKPTF